MHLRFHLNNPFSIALSVGLMHFCTVLVLAQNTEPIPCEECRTEWVSSRDLCDGTECDHGPKSGPPEHQQACMEMFNQVVMENPDLDPNDPADKVTIWLKACWEKNNHVGDCKCFECHDPPECEQLIMKKLTWCGHKQEGQDDATCYYHTDPNAVSELLSYMYETVIVDGSPCTASPETSGYTNHPFCGGGGEACGCTGSSDCVIVFGTYEERTWGKLKVCDVQFGG